MHDDDDTERDLRAAQDLVDPVPAHLLDRAVGGFAWRTIDADLAALVFDSVTEPATVRGAGLDRAGGGAQPRLLTFRADASTLEFELTPAGATLRLVGRVSPAAPGELELRAGTGTVVVTPDDLGRFSTADVPPGPLQLRWRPTGGRAVVTEWLTA
jgi:hypothetical protein